MRKPGLTVAFALLTAAAIAARPGPEPIESDVGRYLSNATELWDWLAPGGAVLVVRWTAHEQTAVFSAEEGSITGLVEIGSAPQLDFSQYAPLGEAVVEIRLGRRTEVRRRSRPPRTETWLYADAEPVFGELTLLDPLLVETRDGDAWTAPAGEVWELRRGSRFGLDEEPPRLLLQGRQGQDRLVQIIAHAVSGARRTKADTHVFLVVD